MPTGTPSSFNPHFQGQLTATLNELLSQSLHSLLSIPIFRGSSLQQANFWKGGLSTAKLSIPIFRGSSLQHFYLIQQQDVDAAFNPHFQGQLTATMDEIESEKLEEMSFNPHFQGQLTATSDWGIYTYLNPYLSIPIFRGSSLQPQKLMLAQNITPVPFNPHFQGQLTATTITYHILNLKHFPFNPHFQGQLTATLNS